MSTLLSDNCFYRDDPAHMADQKVRNTGLQVYPNDDVKVNEVIALGLKHGQRLSFAAAVRVLIHAADISKVTKEQIATEVARDGRLTANRSAGKKRK